MNKLMLTYFSFVAACAVVIVGFITATTFIQLAAAILLYPVLVFFAYKILPLRRKVLVVEERVSGSDEETEVPKREGIGISDIDKRVFLKLIGGTGIFLFLFSLFNKKGENLFFKNISQSASGKNSLEDIAGNKIDPAQNQPLDGYNICEIENNVIAFYGYLNKAGAWVVLRVDTVTASFRYSRGDSNFPGNWSGRDKLKYDYFNNVF